LIVNLRDFATDRQKEILEALETHGSGRAAAEALGVNRSFVHRSMQAVKKKATEGGWQDETPPPHPAPGKRMLVLPDNQTRPGDDFSFLMRIGQYAVEKKPAIILCLGDFADMPSLSSYDKGKKSFEGRRYKRDIEAVHEAMSAFLTPIVDYNAKHPTRPYKPRMVMLLGNHEDRILRACNDDPKLDGVLSIGDLKYADFGWEVHDFLEVVVIEGIAFSHYFTTGQMGRPASSAAAVLNKKHMSCIAGHQQGLQIATGYRGDGTLLTAIIAGSCYEHEEDYLGPQGNKHWRGFLMLNDVRDGMFDLMPVSLSYINKRYPNLKVAHDYAKEPYPEGIR
jgi:hypothetical protein